MSRDPGDFDGIVYDGSGLTVRDGARQVAAALALDVRQAELLAHELRNAILPVHIANPGVGTARVLALADEVLAKG